MTPVVDTTGHEHGAAAIVREGRGPARLSGFDCDPEPASSLQPFALNSGQPRFDSKTPRSNNADEPAQDQSSPLLL